jgi:hypothetical protein
MQVQSPTDDTLPRLTVVGSDDASVSIAGTAKRSFVRENLGLLFCACGFAAGCVFWHYVGFWAVLQAVFYSTGKADRVAEIQAHTQAQVIASATSAPAGVPANVGLLTMKLTADSCTSLMLDRAEGAMTKQPCATEVMLLNSLRELRKQDRRISVAEAKAAARPKAVAPAVASWSSTTVATTPSR